MTDNMKDNRIIFETESYLAVNKPSGLPSLPDVTKDSSVIEMISEQQGIHLFPVNRIDRPVSGILLFGKSSQTAAKLSRQFKHGQVIKHYLAITSEELKLKESALVHFHKRDSKRRKALIRKEAEDGFNKVKLEYKFLARSDRYQLYLLKAEQGRFHQIRAQLAFEGAFVKGDVKYGARRRNKDRSVGLHAWKVDYKCPDDGRMKQLIAPLPDDSLWNFFLPFVNTGDGI
jgi:23S rRNA pseudouridine1911/1915/1917 synthase